MKKWIIFLLILSLIMLPVTVYAQDYEGGYQENEKPDLWMCLLGSVVVGFVVALIATGVMRKNLKSVGFQRAAKAYVRPGSMKLLRVQDIFLYSHVSRIKKPEPSNSRK